MQCPACNTALQMSERSGIEIDYCPSCRGIWLDRGELDKIIERSAGPSRPRDQSHSTGHMPHAGHDPHYRKRKKSFFEELFD